MNQRMACVLSLFMVIGVSAFNRTALSADDGMRRLSSREIIALAVQHNPNLKATLLQRQRAQATIEAEQGLYPFVLDLDGAHNHNSTPTITNENAVKTMTTDVTTLGAELKKSFPIGTATSFRVQGDRQSSDSTFSTAIGENAAPDPQYGLSAKLAVTQPLLRGAGKRVGESGLRQARIQEEMARYSEDRLASELIRNVLLAYWSLWYADRAVDIEIAARDLARTQLEEMVARVSAGEVAPSETLAYETRLASLEETVVSAEAERRRLSIELKRLIGGSGKGDDGLLPLPKEAEEPTIPEWDTDLNTAVEAAQTRSPEGLELKAEIALAEEMVQVAGEDMRPSLNLTGQLGAEVVGNRHTDPIFGELAQNVYSAYVGLVYELPLSDTRRRAERASFEIATKIARQNYAALEDTIAAAVKTAASKLKSSRQILDLATQTAAVAEKQATTERERFELGSSIYLQVKEAEEQARQAKLRLIQARVDTTKAGVELAHLMGELLAHRSGDLNALN